MFLPKIGVWRIELDDRGPEKRVIVTTTTEEEVPVVVSEHRSHRLLLATTTARRNFGGGPDRDHRQGGTATTTPGPRDGSSRAGEITLMTDRDETSECSTAEARSGNTESRIAATMTRKLRVISKSSGASKLLVAAQHRRRY